jgi:hypothetical protein
MPIGKSSITKRVAKQPTETVVEKVTPPTTEKNIAPELVATTAAAPAKKAPAKKPATTATKTTATKSTTAKTAPKTTSTTAKKPAVPKATAPKTTAPKAEKKAVETTVLSNVAPETVEAVIGHKENAKVEKVQIGQKMPSYLL